MEYLSGFRNEHATEAMPGALPQGQNSPQKPAHGLYPEQLNGSAFTAPRHRNLRSWLYKTLPSVKSGEFHSWAGNTQFFTSPCETAPTPQAMRWSPHPYTKGSQNFIESIQTYAVNGNAKTQVGCGVHMYACTESMGNTFFYNADGEMLIVPQEGKLLFQTEMGQLEVEPQEIIIIPRGVRFNVQLLEKKARGYICENYGVPFELPELGPIGANGLANARDFLAPVASFQDQEDQFEVITKYLGQFFSLTLDYHPLNTVAWYGNYYPYKYDLRKFNTIGSISYDHPDPSIFTVLTSPSSEKGRANIDFAIFPPRWLVAENTFRPPYYHRNVMSEFMGLVHGTYDAKEDGFAPGGASLHNCMTGHGPDSNTFEAATAHSGQPYKVEDTMAFMFESRYVFETFATQLPTLNKAYFQCWQGLKKLFKGFEKFGEIGDTVKSCPSAQSTY